MSAPLMRLTCPACASDVHADDIHPEQGIAACRGCKSVFRLGSPSSRATAPRPKSIQESRSGARLTFRRRWWSLKIIFMTFFCIAWFGFLAVWYLMSSTVDEDPVRGVMMLFPIIHVAAGLWVLYYTLAGYVNTTTVELDRGYLSVRHGPLPWPGAGEIPTSSLKQLFCTRHEHRTKNGIHFTYRLNALLGDGRTRKIVSGLDAPDVPLYLEQQLEEFLRIPDARVPGEMAY